MDLFTHDDSQNFFKNLSLLLSTQKNSDVTLIVEEEKIPAHRLVLALQSDFFEKLLFENQFKEGELTEIPIQAPLEAFKLVMSFLYTAKLSLNSYYTKGPVYIELLDLSKRFGIKNLEQTMIRYFLENASPSNYFQLLKLSILYESNALRERCIHSINTSNLNYLSYAKAEVLDIDTIRGILSNSEMKPAMKKFRVLQQWWTHNGSRHTDVARKELTDLIDVTECSNRQIFELIWPSKLFEAGYLMDILSKRSPDDEVFEEAGQLHYNSYETILGVRSTKSKIESEETLIIAVPYHHLAYCVTFKVLARPLDDPVEDVSFSRNMKSWSNFSYPDIYSDRRYHYEDKGNKGFRYVKIRGKNTVRAVKFGVMKDMSHSSC